MIHHVPSCECSGSDICSLETGFGDNDTVQCINCVYGSKCKYVVGKGGSQKECSCVDAIIAEEQTPELIELIEKKKPVDFPVLGGGWPRCSPTSVSP